MSAIRRNKTNLLILMSAIALFSLVAAFLLPRASVQAKAQRTITMTATNTGFNYNGTFPPQALSLISYTYDAYENGAKVGQGAGSCINVSSSLTNCSNTLTVTNQGTLVFEGVEQINAQLQPSPAEVPVVGGTGTFAGARGYVDITPVPGPNNSLVNDLVFHLT